MLSWLEQKQIQKMELGIISGLRRQRLPWRLCQSGVKILQPSIFLSKVKWVQPP